MKNVIILLIMVMVGCMDKTPTPVSEIKKDCVIKIVQSVGGCNQYGRCGVTFTDLSVGKVLLPSIFMEVEVCKESR